jgi:anaerobic magnesium-protoporphyrin IX monomethyl ester cyclase
LVPPKKQIFKYKLLNAIFAEISNPRMKVLLATLNAKFIHLNLAIRLLFELNRDQAGLDWKEFTIKENRDEIADFCKDFDIIAFSCYIWNITQTLEVCRKIKAINPKIKILLGGPEVSYEWQDVIIRDEVDFIITGEGETPFTQFLNFYPHVETVANLISKKENGEVVYFEDSTTFELANFRHILPYQRDTKEDLDKKVCYIETSRGCPYKCEFCLASLDNKVRYLPMEHIEANLLYLMQNGRTIKFLDRTFNMKRDFTIAIFQFILDNHRPENVFQFEITADILHPDIIKFVREKVPKGLFRFEIGIQTVNQKANLEVSRKQNFYKTKDIIQQLDDIIEMHLDLIVGLPLDYWDDIKFSFEEVFKLFAPELQLGFLKFLKGTPVRYKYAEHGFVFDPEPPYQLIESNYLSKNQLIQLENLENALEIYWNKKRTPYLLKYVTANYSVFEFLLGLGNYFGTRKDFHKHTLPDIFEILNDFAKINYPDDKVIEDLIGIDYYLYHKIKPEAKYLTEMARTDKFNLIAQKRLNHQKYRYMIFPIAFDFNKFDQENIIEPSSENLIIQFNGTTKAEVVG